MSDDEDDYVSFGAALKPLDNEENIRKKPIAVEEQIVRDVNGIRRFHGAFTGGFSAGHFNTVNTPQGWYPKQFKSSRESKSEKSNQKPEDFMDDEDVGAFGFAAQGLKTKSNFQGGITPNSATESRNAIPLGGLLEQLVKPANSTVGENLLIKQGWKPGSGIGPKATKQNKIARLSSHIKTYGCALPEEKDADTEETLDPMIEKYKDFLFAPDEIPINVAKPKDNFFGIGYSGLDKSGGTLDGRINANYSVKTNLNFNSNNKKKFSISGEAFGIGADEEDDDLEVYNRGDMAQYDFSLDVTGEDRKERREKKGSRWDEVARGSRKGSDYVEGFSPATTHSLIKKHYPSPQVPSDWKPKAHPGQRIKPSRFGPIVSQVAPAPKVSRWDQKSVNGNNPTIDQRRSKLFPDESNISEVNVKNEVVDDSKDEIPDFLLNYQSENSANKSGFKPFARDEAKQLRYEQFLVCIENNRGDALSILQPKTMTEWEKERERVEFERASMLFKPMKGVIGSRFVSAGGSEDADNSKEGLTEGDEAGGQARKAADMKMFGKLTRTVEEWHPAKLLCVRFNVAHPFGDYSIVGTREKAKRETNVTNVFASLEVQSDTVPNITNSESEKTSEELKTEGSETSVDIKTTNDIAVKPPADLFKAIFVDSDSESDSDEEGSDKKNEASASTSDVLSKVQTISKTPATVATKPWEEKQGNVLRNKEPARGIFANIDLDSLNRKSSHTEGSSSKSGSLSVANQTVRTVLGIKKDSIEINTSDDEYGPKLPPVMIPNSIVISSDSDEGNSHRIKSKKRKDKKKHKKKERVSSRKEKKKHKRHSSSGSDSYDESRKRKKHRNDESYKHKRRRRSSSST